MSRQHHLTGDTGAQFHPVSHYASPADVLHDTALSANEKRIILSSWACDMYAVDSRPALRKIPGIVGPIHLEDILAALRQLDVEEEAPRVEAGSVAMTAPAKATTRNRFRIAIPSTSPWSAEANVRRYRRLLATQLTENERLFVEQRMAEELAQLGTTRIAEP